MAASGLHGGHRERMRKRALNTDFNGFQEHELLELILFYALPRVNTNNIAHQLIEEFGDISRVLDASPSELASVNGLSSSSTVLISLMRDLCRYYTSSTHSSVKFSSTDELKQYFLDYFSDNNSEICLILSVDGDFKLNSTLNYPTEALISPSFSVRLLAETILRGRMERIIIGQNHPDKPPIPCDENYAVTRLFAETLTPLGVEIYDHIICGQNTAFSMRQKGAFSFFTSI